MKPNQQALFDELPEEGTITYRELHQQLSSTGKASLLREFHTMRREGLLYSVNDPDDARELIVAREAPDA